MAPILLDVLFLAAAVFLAVYATAAAALFVAALVLYLLVQAGDADRVVGGACELLQRVAGWAVGCARRIVKI